MRTGKSIAELASQLQDLKDHSRDFIVPTERMEVKLNGAVPGKETPVLAFTNGSEQRLSLNPWSDRQLATYAEVPQAYYERLKGESPRLFADNVNHGLRRQARSTQGESRMVRTHRGAVRAFVSARYRRLDCFDLFASVAPVMVEQGLQVVSSELTDRRMYLQSTTPRIAGEVKKGDVVQYGLVISSSDVGAGSVRVEPMIYRLVCLNGMISQSAIRKFHIGRNQGEDDAYELLTDGTKDLTDAAFWAQVRDVVVASMRPELFQRQVDRLRLAANEPIRNFDLPRVVELASRQVGVASEGVKRDVLAYLANGADGAGLTRWGLVNAFTAAAANEKVGYDDAVDLERAGAKVLDLTANQWQVISSAPAAQ